MRKSMWLLIALVAIACSRAPRFRMMDPEKTGVEFANNITESDSLNIMKYEYIYNGAGVGVADLNNDGLQDLIFAGNQVSPRVYLNLGNFKFRDITSNFEGMDDKEWYSGVAVVDINADGWPDVYMTATSNRNPLRRVNKLWVNSGCEKGKDPVFREMAKSYGIADTIHSVNAAFFDYDRDGFLDLYILNNTVTSRMNAVYRLKINDGTADNNDRLYHNNGNGTFTDVTKKAGIIYEGFGLGLAIGDINKDGYPDIYVSNDYISNDLLYINQGDGTFRNEIAKYMSYQSKSSMGNDMADINNDGNPDMYTLDMLPESNYKKKQTINGYAYTIYVKDDKYGYEHQYVRNMLQLHNGFIKGQMLPFSEVGQMMGIPATEWSWSPLFADYNNDGKKDLIVSRGYPRDETDKDWTRLKAQSSAYSSEQYMISMAPPIKIPNIAFENVGEKGFVKRQDWLPVVPAYSYGAVFVDLDNDGDLDFVVNNLDSKAFVLRNTTRERNPENSHYIRIRLTGKGGNTMAIGAKAELWSGGKYQYTEHFLSRGYASSVDPVIHFGLGKNKIIDSLKITWPATGYITVLKNLAADKLIDINEKDSRPSYVITNDKKVYLFKSRDSILDYRHEQKDYIDFYQNQPIIPHKFSQIGPRMAKGDLNGDGREDLIIGSTNLLPTEVFVRKGNRFVRKEIEGLTTQKPFTEADLAIVDINHDGKNDVIAVAGGYENENEQGYIHYLYENRGDKFIATALPVPQFPASVVRTCDYDHDGNIDLFIGARVKKGMFPYSNHSWILHNDNGKFSEKSCTRLNLGLVTDAIWTDYDNDGWEDLLVAREYNSVVLLKNIQGKRFEPQVLPELENMHGIWFSLAAGDFNGDGYTDYIVGNLGENNRFTVSDKYPQNLYAIDLDNDGNLDPILTAFWPDRNGTMKEYPMNYLDELWYQSRYFVNKITGYTEFSYLSVPEIIDSKAMKRLEFKLWANTTSSYILWNNKGRFTWEKLPVQLQESPVKKMIVADFNGDGYPDILIGGNDYTYELGTGIYDANKGFVLLNKGKKKEKDGSRFDLLTPSESGILLQGMLESLLYLKGDTSLVVAGLNRAKATVFEHVKTTVNK